MMMIQKLFYHHPPLATHDHPVENLRRRKFEWCLKRTKVRKRREEGGSGAILIPYGSNQLRTSRVRQRIAQAGAGAYNA